MIEDAKPAGLLKRFMALVYDGFLVIALWFVSAGLFVLLYNHTGLPVQDINGVTRADPMVLRGVLFPLLILETWAFYAWFWLHGGQTLGMRAWRLQVRKEDGGAVSWPRAGLRFLFAIPAWGLCGLGVFWAIPHPQNKTWQDLLSGTETVLLPAPRADQKIPD